MLQGMKYIMTNFNHERLSIAVNVTRQARVALSSAFEYVLKREAFGRPLMDQPVVRHRLAKAGALLESQWAWVEQFAYQLTQMKKEESDVALGGLTGLLKANAGMVLKECADTAMLLFGGNGYTQSGQGELIESMLFSPSPSLTGSVWATAMLTNLCDPEQCCGAKSLARESPAVRRTSCSILPCASSSSCTRRRL